MKTQRQAVKRHGVSVITCTHHPNFMRNVFNNYKRQVLPAKELIIVLNNDRMSLAQWRKKARKYNKVSVYKLPQKTSLGRCLNFAVAKSRYPYIAKFDHDDYYGPRYLTDALKAFQKTGADIVGKRSHYTYITDKKLLIIRYPGYENKFVSLVHGGSITARRKVFARVKFPNLSLGEDVRFLRTCRAKGYKIYSNKKSNFLYIRRKNNHLHTWKTDLRYLLKNSKIVGKMGLPVKL